MLTDCEELVSRALHSPLVKSLLAGLRSQGCQFDVVRHLVCEPCQEGLAGGFDLAHNQIVLCTNQCRTEEQVTTLLAHELVHMYDQCVNKMDWTNLRHLACSEVRAASLAHCQGPVSSALHDGGAWTKVKSQHGECVKSKAARSVQLIKKCSKEEARVSVEEIFSKCYRDLEPVGRYRCR